MEIPMPPQCPKCNSVAIKLLSANLELLISTHGLHELLDRLESMVNEQSQLKENLQEDIQPEWNQLITFLEQARWQALRLANILHTEHGRGVWG
jgi:hypothetical protein